MFSIRDFAVETQHWHAERKPPGGAHALPTLREFAGEEPLGGH